MKDFRPISCCNVLYKVFSGILTTGLNKIMANFIGAQQSAFVKGRQLADNVLLMHELVKGYQRESSKPRVVLKLDIVKVYDSVNWEFM